MPYAVNFNSAAGVVESSLFGDVTIEEVQSEMAEALGLGIRQQCSRYFTDLSKAAIKFSFIEAFSLPADFERLGAQRPVWVAMIPPPAPEHAEVIEFCRTIGLNRGWFVEIFDDRDSAMQWLATSSWSARQ